MVHSASGITDIRRTSFARQQHLHSSNTSASLGTFSIGGSSGRKLSASTGCIAYPRQFDVSSP